MPSAGAHGTSVSGPNGPAVASSAANAAKTPGPTACITSPQLDLLEKLLRQGISSELNARAMTNALSQAQLSIGAMQKRIIELEKLNANLMLVQGGAARDAATQAAMDKMSHNLKHLGTAFQLLWDPFCSDEDLAALYEKGFILPTIHPEDVERYADADCVAQGAIIEILNFTPSRYQENLLLSNIFAHQLCKQVQTTRSSALDCLRRCVDVLFPTLPGNIFGHKPAARNARQSCPDLWGKHLGLAAATDQLESLFPPVLYQDFNKNDKSSLFLAEVLITVVRITIYGPTRHRDEKAMPQSNSIFASNELSIQATPGMISWSAVVTIYLLSSDGELMKNGIGSYSGINYKQYLADFKQMIISAKRSLWFENLIATWQKAVFLNSKSPTPVEVLQPGNGGEGEGRSKSADPRRVAQSNELLQALQQLTLSEASSAGVLTARADNPIAEAGSNVEAGSSGEANSLAVAQSNHAAGTAMCSRGEAGRDGGNRNSRRGGLDGDSGDSNDEEGSSDHQSGGEAVDDNDGAESGRDAASEGSNRRGRIAAVHGEMGDFDSETDEEEGQLSHASVECTSSSACSEAPNNNGKAQTSQSHRVPRPSLADMEPDVPPSPPPAHSLHRTFTFIEGINNPDFPHAHAVLPSLPYDGPASPAHVLQASDSIPASNAAASKVPAVGSDRAPRAPTKKPRSKTPTAESINMAADAPKPTRLRTSRAVAKSRG